MNKISSGDIIFLSILKNTGTGIFLGENCFSLKLFLMFFLKTDNIILDPDPNWANIPDPDPNSMYLDPQHCPQVKQAYKVVRHNIEQQARWQQMYRYIPPSFMI